MKKNLTYGPQFSWNNRYKCLILLLNLYTHAIEIFCYYDDWSRCYVKSMLNWKTIHWWKFISSLWQFERPTVHNSNFIRFFFWIFLKDEDFERLADSSFCCCYLFQLSLLSGAKAESDEISKRTRCRFFKVISFNSITFIPPLHEIHSTQNIFAYTKHLESSLSHNVNTFILRII